MPEENLPIKLDRKAYAEEFPKGVASATECLANIMRTHDLCIGVVNRWIREEFGLSQPSSHVLCIIEGAGEPISPHVISERVYVTSATVTSILDTLEKRGLVQRVAHPDDRRKILVGLTADGLDVVELLLPGFHSIEREMMSSLSQKEQGELVRLLGKVANRALEMQSRPYEPPPREPRIKPTGERYKIK